MITFKYLKIEKLKFVSCFVLGASCFAVLLFAPHAFAAQDGFIALAPIPNLTEGITADSAGLALFFNNLYKYLIGIAAILAVLQIMWSGIKIATNQDSISSIIEWKKEIMQAIYGLALVLSPVVVFSIINPSILNLSLNLPALDTKTATSTPAVTAPVSKTKPLAPLTPSYSPYQSCTASTCSDIQKACAKGASMKKPNYGVVVRLKQGGVEDPQGTINKPARPFACAAGSSLAVKCVTF